MTILFSLNQYNQQRQHEKKRWVFPIYLAMYATHLRNQGYTIIWDDKSCFYHKVITNESQIDVPFLDLPHADRLLTDAKNKKWQANGNFLYRPGTYILSALGCFWGQCTFCVENGVQYQTRNPDDVINEMMECKVMGFREIFDDSATLPMGVWLKNFIEAKRKYLPDMPFSCNMRMVDYDYSSLERAGFRMILFGAESANQRTLDKINKGRDVGDIKYVIEAAKAGLDVHVAFMVGYPWETEEETLNTVNLVKWLLLKGYAKTAQVSFYTPPSNQEQGNEAYRKYVNKFYEVGYNPLFMIRKLSHLRNLDEVIYLWRSIKAGLKRN